MKKNTQRPKIKVPPWSRVVWDSEKNKNPVPSKIELGLLVNTTLALQQNLIGLGVGPDELIIDYECLAEEAELLIDACQKVISKRDLSQSSLDKKAALDLLTELPRDIPFAEGVFRIVGDRNPGRNRGLKKLEEFLRVFYGESGFLDPDFPSCAKWVESWIQDRRHKNFNAKELAALREKRNEYIERKILDGTPVSSKK